jgi:hypothetical protein
MPLIATIQEHLSERIERCELTNDELVQLIEHIGSYFNIATIPDYANANKMSYNGVKKFRTIKTIFNTKYVIDND